MKFSELNPAFHMAGCKGYEGVNQLCFDCPECRHRIVIYARLNGPMDASKSIWQWSHKPDVAGWDSITIEPSIQNHPVPKRGAVQCRAHFSITDGEVR